MRVVAGQQHSIAIVAAAFDAVAARTVPRADAAIVAACRDALIAAYAGVDRHYHDIGHIAAMLTLLDCHAPPEVDHEALRWAILFHDVIYDARRSDNEEASAARAEADLASMAVDTTIRARVCDLVLATRHANSSQPADVETALLLDLDLAVLASSAAAYADYAAAIRREYAHAPEPLYRAGRARVLQNFLDRPRLYVTPALAAQWETLARRNLASEIEALRNGG